MIRQSPGGATGVGGSHKPFAPRSLSLSKEASAKLIVGRGTTAANPIAYSSGAASRTGASQSSQGQPRHLSRAGASASSSVVSSPASSSSGIGSGGGGVSAPPHGGSNEWTRGASGGSGGAHGRYFSHSASRLERNSSGGTCTTAATSASSICSSGGGGCDGDGGLRQHRGKATDSPGDQQQPPLQKQPQPQQQQQQARRTRDGEASNSFSSSSVSADGAGSGQGSILPGPEGAVEVREFDGGVLVVRRSEAEKKRSPERLNLHRRQLKSCPLVQVCIPVGRGGKYHPNPANPALHMPSPGAPHTNVTSISEGLGVTDNVCLHALGTVVDICMLLLAENSLRVFRFGFCVAAAV